MNRLVHCCCFIILATATTVSFTELSNAVETSPAKSRIVVLTDISNEPDDEESLVRFLVYADQFDVEGLIATTSTWLRRGPREDLIRRHLNAYAQVLPNLGKHAAGYPSAESLMAVTATGQPEYGMAAVGPGKTTPGSRLILQAARRPDPRPLWITVWGGANTLAQALDDARRECSPKELRTLTSRLRVYTISDQDDAGPWLRKTFPDLFYIVSPSTTDWKEYWRATWTGISGDRHYKNGPYTTISTWSTTLGWKKTSFTTTDHSVHCTRDSNISWKAIPLRSSA
ncbi:hypothetical protein JCM19992_20570 [Thermostilla marina]